MQSDSRLLFDDEFDDTTNEIAGEGEFLSDHFLFQIFVKEKSSKLSLIWSSHYLKIYQKMEVWFFLTMKIFLKTKLTRKFS